VIVSFAKEQEEVIYGVLPALKSNNPFKVFFHGFIRLGQKMQKAPGLGSKLACLYKGAGWTLKMVEESR